MPTRRELYRFSDTQPERLDVFLKNHFSTISRNYLQELIAKGFVQVNGKLAKKSALLTLGDKVSINPFLWPEERKVDPNFSLQISIVWQGKELLVVDKPAGISTHPNDYEDHNTLVNALLARFPGISEVGDDPLRPGIVHRLDMNTSGLLLVAKSQDMFQSLRNLFDLRKVKKTYLALVLGTIERAGKVTTALAHHPRNPRKMVAVEEGSDFRSRPREACTMFHPVSRYGDFTLLSVRTLTGRMHQVRVHVSSIGHPLAGDRLYQTAKERSQDRSGLQRHFLHASRIELPENPRFENTVFESPLPPELTDVLTTLEKL